MSVLENQLAALTCLVVDDDAHFRDVLTAALQTLGIKQPLSAPNGSKAFELLKASKRTIDIVLSDIRMPDGNGLQLLHAVRTGAIKSMRINSTFVLVTAFPTPDAVKMASSLDANGFVVKPVVPEKLEAALLKARRIVFPPASARYAEVSVPETI